MGITTRLKLISALTIGALLVLVPVLVWSLMEFRNAKRDYALAEAIRVNFFERVSCRDQYFLYREDRLRMQWEQGWKTATGLLDQAEAQFRQPQDRQLLARLRQNQAESRAIFQRIVANTGALRAAGGNRQAYEELDKRLASQLLRRAAAFRDGVAALQEASAREVEATYLRLIVMVGVFAATLALVTVFTSVHLVRLIRKRLALLHEGARIIAAGDLDHRIACGGSDEFAELARSIDAMTDRLQEFTRRLEAEARAHKQAADMLYKLSIAIEQSPAAVVITDPDTRIEYVNPRFTDVTGYLPGEVIGQDIGLLQTGPGDADIHQDLWGQLRQGLPWTGEFLNQRKNGEVYWEENHIAPIKDPTGAITHYVAVKTDISERKRIEAALQESEQRYHFLFDNNPLPMWVFAEDSLQFLVVNARAIEHYGYSREEFSRMTVADIRPEEDVADFHRALAASPRGKVPGTWRHRKKDGTVIQVEVNTAPMAYGTIPARITLMQDITERLEYEGKLIALRDAAEKASRAKSDFLAMMSHEIRTPMNGILGMAQLLLMPELGAQERTDYAHTILTSGHTLLALLNDILDLAKIEAGKLALTRAAFSPEQVVSETLALFAEPAQLKGLRLAGSWQGPAGQRYWSDPVRVRQMLTNLVSNAIKFTDGGDIRIEAAEIENGSPAAVLEFAVTDGGIGIPADKQARLFQPFSQVDSSTTRKYGGTGLGLSIVATLAKAMEGEVGVNSAPGQGSRFWFRIRAERLLPGEESRLGERGADFWHMVGKPPGWRGKVLVVEDNPINRKVAEALLGKLGLRAEHAGNGQEAVDALQGGSQPDLVLMDVQMPVMDGFEATARIRQWEQATGRAPVPIVALTAGVFEEEHQHCLAAGMSDFLAKPIRLEKLVAALAKWIGRDAKVQGFME